MSFFYKDLKAAEILTAFLDRQYLKRGWQFERIRYIKPEDIERQKSGIDLIRIDNEEKIHIDEKAQLHYIGKNLPTFALEIDYLYKNEFRKGWLFHPEKDTAEYALVCNICVDNNENELKKLDDIVSCEVVFVNRVKLINELAKMGLTEELCIQISQVLREGNEDDNEHNVLEGLGYKRERKFNNGDNDKICKVLGPGEVRKYDDAENPKFSFQCSIRLEEKPINLVMGKAWLEKLGEKHTFTK